MEKEIPKISYNKDQGLDIEVMSFSQLFGKLNSSIDHNPFELHKIEFFLIMIVTKGSFTHFVDFNAYALTTGDAIFIAKDQLHHFSKALAHSEGYCIIFNSLFTDKYHFLSGNVKLNRLFNYHIETPVISKNEMGQDSFADIAHDLYAEFIFPNTFAKAEIMSTLLQVLFLKAERTKEDQAISGIKPHWLETFSAFKNMLQNDYVNTRNARLYASKLFISYKFLNDIVKKLTGKTVKAFIDDFVTTEIKRYLVSTALSVKEISYRTGFEDSANMVKFFKKNTFTTPLKFRHQP